jgi:hypothetical protein
LTHLADDLLLSQFQLLICENSSSSACEVFADYFTGQALVDPGAVVGARTRVPGP